MTRYNHFGLLTIIGIFLTSPIFSQKEDLQVTYIGNMGVCLEYQNQQILIDALHLPYRATFLAPNPEMLRTLTEGKSPFERIHFLLTTHPHNDHMHAGAIEKFLVSNPKRKLLGPPQVIDKVTSLQASLQSQCVKMNKEHTIYQDSGLIIEAFKIPHVSPARHGSVENLAYYIQWSNLSVLHVGDMQDDETSLVKFPDDLQVDVAIVPRWILLTDETKNWIIKKLAPKLVVATHISPLDVETSIQMIKKSFPGAHCFTKSKETLIFTPDTNRL